MGIPITGASGAYIRNLMDLPTGKDWPTLRDQALDRVLKVGIQNDRQDVYVYRLARVNTGGVSRLPEVDWGVIAECADCATQETRRCALGFNDIDFGARVRHASIIRNHLAIADRHEIHHCTPIHLIAAMEWGGGARKSPKGIPTFTRSHDLAVGMREVDIENARQMVTLDQRPERFVDNEHYA